METTTLVPGQNFRAELDAFAGEPIDYRTPIIDTCIYVTPTWKAWRLPGGAIVVLVDGCGASGCSVAYRMANYGEFYEWKRWGRGEYRDPETGKTLREIGRRLDIERAELEGRIH